jgi:hypothetical protein
MEGPFPERRVLERKVKWGERRRTTEGVYRAEDGTLARALRCMSLGFGVGNVLRLVERKMEWHSRKFNREE